MEGLISTKDLAKELRVNWRTVLGARMALGINPARLGKGYGFTESQAAQIEEYLKLRLARRVVPLHLTEEEMIYVQAEAQASSMTTTEFVTAQWRDYLRISAFGK